MSITVDERTGSAELLQYFPPGIAKLGRLTFADAAFLGKGPDDIPTMVGIERKTLNDLVGSLESGRFAGHQLPGLLSSYGCVYLIIEGISRVKNGYLEELKGHVWRALNFSERGFNNYLNTLSVLGGLIIRQTAYPQRTAELIYTLFGWWEKGWDKHKSHLGFAEVPKAAVLLTKPSLLRRIAKELPGIAWERSAAVEQHFPSVFEMVGAAPDEWQDIPGIGKVLAGRIVEAIRSQNEQAKVSGGGII